MAEWILRADGLRKLYGSAGVVEASVGICPGEAVAVLGRSGSGKSTLMAMLAGLCRPQRGSVQLLLPQPRDLWSLSTAERCRLRRGPIGFISQFTSLLPSLSTLENVLLPALLAGRSRDGALLAEAERWLAAVQLDHRQQVPAALLSGGEQRRAIVARALLTNPAVLLADEPTSNLDGESETELFALLQDLCRRAGTALLMVTHSDALAQHCDRMLWLEAGVLREAGSSVVSAPLMPLPPPGDADGDAEAVPDPSRRRLLAGGAAAGLALVAGAGGWGQWWRGQQRRALQHRDQLQRLAFSGLSAELTALERLGPSGYRGTIAVDNLDRMQALYLLPLDVQLYVQQGSRWNPYAAAWSEDSRSVLAVEQPAGLHVDLLDLPDRFTELVPGYMHVRLDVTYAISDRPDPDAVPVERRDSFFVYLLPLNPDPERIAQNAFPGEVPLFIPMPPH
jgi:putative ABC transport system ATP-binding protein/macrolide transport system ATP-binding/permease protein/lipoprotein-releasing system ATP-binding protein